ncbi:hypothetical protein [Paraburkholderia tropica]|uniref:hypothetical protein n=1 Tax=Paraburkholderia tropica TaxID=92647 RepID=UPI001F4765CF|nr:hypothetical protein [Paraburkholderia tropica]
MLQTGICAAPKRILAISFKRDAAKKLADRVVKRCTPDRARRFDSYTFDAFAKSLVDRFRAAIPAQCRPPADYRVVMPSRRDYSEFLELHEFNRLFLCGSGQRAAGRRGRGEYVGRFRGIRSSSS